MSHLICQSCGARLREDAEKCDLCGTVVGATARAADVDAAAESLGADQVNDDGVEMGDARAASPRSDFTEDRRFCTQCGKPNPVDARFCSWCGSPQQERNDPASIDESPSRSPVAPRPTAAAPHPKGGRPPKPAKSAPKNRKARGSGPASRQVLLLVGGSIIVVVVLFGLSLLSDGPSAPPAQSATPATAPSTTQTGGFAPAPLTPEVQQAVSGLQERIAQAASEDEKQPLRRLLVDLYQDAGRMDLAAAVQEELAAVTNTAEAWAGAGNLHFDLMESLPAGPEKGAAARRAIAAYSRSIEIDPTNNDVRTDRAVAYLNDPESPMQAIEEINTVLASDPDHPQANFNKAVMMLMIGRSDQALELYRKVTTLTAPDTPMHQEAHRRAEELERQLPANP